MKKQLLLIITILFLSGCTIPFMNDFKEEILEVDVVIEEVAVLGVSADEEVEIRKSFNCNMIQTKSSKEDCENMVNEMVADMLSSEIRRTFDISRCDELSSWNIEGCKKRIQKTGVQGPIMEQEIEDLRIAQRCSYKVIEGNEESNMMEEESSCEYDITKCADLTALGLKEYCEKMVGEKIEQDLIWKIVEGGDSTKCDTLTSKNAKDTCKMELGAYLEEEMVEGGV